MLKNLFKNVAKGDAPAPVSSAKLNVGCGRHAREGWVNLDSQPLPQVDVVADLDRCRSQPLPFPDDSFDEFFASHVLEHLNDPLGCMQELHRVARPNARFEVRVPHGASDDADVDPTHVKRYFPRSFRYFSQPLYRRFDYGYRGDWETERIQLIVYTNVAAGRSDEQLIEAIGTLRNIVREMRVFLRAVKPARAPGEAATGMPVIQILREAPSEED